MEFNKVIFLDIDVVLATLNEFNMNRFAPLYVHQYNIYPFNKRCVKALNELLKITAAEIILSSDWRTFFSLEEMQDIFKINGVIANPMAATPDLHGQHKAKRLEEIRILEIQSFLKENTVERFVVLDDLDMSEAFGEKFIGCFNSREGIKAPGLLNKVIVSLY
jgi:hypothetical protein